MGDDSGFGLVFLQGCQQRSPVKPKGLGRQYSEFHNQGNLFVQIAKAWRECAGHGES